MAEDTKKSGAASSPKATEAPAPTMQIDDRKLDESKVPAGIEVQTGEAAPAPTKSQADAERRQAVEAAGFVMLKANPHVVASDVFVSGDFRIGRTPVAVPASQVEALTAHKDDFGRQLVVKA